MKKINIGIILTIIVVIAITIHIIIVENTLKQDFNNMELVLNDYFKVYNKYSLLPENSRDIDKNIDAEEYTLYLVELKNELSKFVLNEYQDEIFSNYKQRLENQVLSQYMFKEYVKEISSIENKYHNNDYFIFDLNIKITVNRDKRVSPIFNEETGKYIGDIKQQIGIDTTKETVIFKKINNEYKIVYHGIIDPSTFKFEMENYGGIVWQTQY